MAKFFVLVSDDGAALKVGGGGWQTSDSKWCGRKHLVLSNSL